MKKIKLGRRKCKPLIDLLSICHILSNQLFQLSAMKNRNIWASMNSPFDSMYCPTLETLGLVINSRIRSNYEKD